MNSVNAPLTAGYRIVETLCRHAGFTLFRARRPEGEPVLLKLIHPSLVNSVQAARLRHEYRLLQSLHIPGVAKPQALIDESGAVAEVFEDFAGESLDIVLHRERLDLPACLGIACRLAAILAKVHAAPLIHRDLRPLNILTTPERDICLVDFSLATTETLLAPDLAAFGGDLAYLSPEQTGRMNRMVDYRTDFYSLGVTLYRMFEGQLPFQAGDPLEWVHCHVARLPRPLHEAAPDVPRPVSDIVMKLLAKMAEDRYHSAQGLHHDLERCRQQWAGSGRITPFALGTQDISDRFQIPQKVYGRETEITQLLTAFNQTASSGRPSLVLVKGNPGIGKSMLVCETRRPVAQARGYFIVGKFDQYRHDIPYATVTTALRDLVQQILTESEVRIAAWRQQLQAALGTEGQLVIDVIPQLELIIGPQPKVQPLPPEETRHRFQRVFQRFIGLFTAQRHPLVLFLDDVQWIDAASLALITHLLTHSQTCYLMLVATYRDNEVSAAHPLMAAVEAMRHKVAVQEIHLGPLPDDALVQLLAETLHCANTAVAPLNVIIQHKTHGNPFFVNQFLLTLQRDGLITFDPQLPGWRWHLQHIEAAGVTANVVEWMAGRISRLPPASQAMLKWAACLGHQFELTLLAQVAGRPPTEVAAQLEPAVRQGFFLVAYQPGEFSADWQQSYRWSHDRVQQAAYSLIAESERPRVHLQIGRLLLERVPEERLAENIFEILSHLNAGAALVTHPMEQQRLAELNLIATRRAKRAAASAAACNYAAIGVAQLPPGAWQQHYALTMALHRELIEATYLCRHPEEAETLFERTLPLVKAGPDQAELLKLRVVFTVARREETKAVQLGLEALRPFGLTLPATPEAWAAALPPAIERMDQLLADVCIEDLAERPPMTDPTSIAVTDLLAEIMTAAWNVDLHLYSLLAIAIVEQSLAHGNTAASALGYCGFGVVLHRFRHDLERGYRFGKLARRLAERLDRPNVAARTDFHVSAFLAIWYEPLEQITARRLKDFSVALEHGDLTYAGYHLLHTWCYRFACGEPLERIAEGLGKALAFIEQNANDLAFRPLQDLDHLVAALRGQAAAAPESIDAVLERLRDRTDNIVKYEYLAALKHFLIFGALDDALRLVRSPGAAVMTARLSYLGVEWGFYHALAVAQTYSAQDQATRRATLALLQTEHAKLIEDAQRCPANFAPFQHLLAAESARITGVEPVLTISRYEEAIASAARYGATHLQALAAECAARACEAVGAIARAVSYWQKARAAYAAWGADAKVRQLDAQARLRQAAANLGQGTEQLDFLSIVKASQAISGEIVLERLLETLMRVVIESAGAQKGDLILLHPTGLALAAEARVLEQQVEVQLQQASDMQNISGMPQSLLPTSILNYVRRSQEPVLLEDVTQPNHFSSDPYWQEQHPKSVLCLPILRQAKLVGLLYLENNLATRAFTYDHLAVLELLASQAAISLENAQLFTALQQENNERKQAEARLRRLVESNLIGIVFAKNTGELTYANDAFLDIIGYTREDLADDKLCWQDITPPEYLGVMEKAIDEIKRSGASKPYEKEYIRKDGRRVPVVVGAVRFNEEQGAAFVLDLTERKQAEAERAARKVAEAASEAKSAFLANMSHELRSPLNTMLGFGRLMERSAALPRDVKEDLKIMLRSGEHLRTLINQILDLARIEAGRAVLNETSFDLHVLLDELADMFALKAEEKGLALRVEQRDIPRFIRSDPVKLRQVLINLLGNALKFTRQGSVSLCVTRLAMPGGPGLHFAVEDTGAGIAPQELAQLFKPFMQAGAGRQAREGTGLGLTISRSFVQLMGGDIHIDSVPGQGSSISFAIPVQMADTKATAVSAQAKRRVVALAPGQPHYRILAVDDRQDARQLLTRLLAPLGFDIREADNGEQAVTLWQTWQPHLIWMDMRMPVLDGYATTRRIRASPQGKTPIIIALTASSFEEERINVMEAGCDDFLRKPFHEDDLFSLMQKHLGVHFIFQEEPAAGPVQAGALAALPDVLKDALEQALIRLDTEAVTDVIAKVRDAPLAHALQRLADDFQYGQILHLVRDANAKG